MPSYEEKVLKNYEIGVKYPLLIVDNGQVIEIKVTQDDEGKRTYRKKQNICNEIRVKNIYRDIVTKEEVCSIAYISVSGEEQEIEVRTEELANKSLIISLAKFGVDVNSINANDVIKHINNEMGQAKSNLRTSKLGFIENVDKKTFVGAHTLVREDGKNTIADIEYYGKMNVSQKGDREVYRKMIEEDVIRSIPLTAMLLIGLSAPLVGFVGKECNVNNLLVHISGDSSTGKSTALKLAISSFGSVSNEEGTVSLFSSWNTTENAMLEMLAGNNGIPIALDEAGMARNRNFSGTIYKLSEGKEKMRMTFGVGNNDVRSWQTSIISSGEIPIDDDDLDRASGIGIRLISLEGVQWTDNAEHSERVMKVIQHNYGYLGEDFVKKILKIDTHKIIEVHGKEVSKEVEMLKCGKFNERIANYLAMIVVSGKILKRMKFDVDIEGVRSFLVNKANETKGYHNSLGERARDLIIAEIIQHQNQIERRAKNGTPIEPVFGEIWGVGYGEKVSDKNIELEEIAIQIKNCDEILKAKGFKNSKEVYRQWLEKGYIRKNSKGSYIHKVKLGNIAQAKCIRMIMEGVKIDEN